MERETWASRDTQTWRDQRATGMFYCFPSSPKLKRKHNTSLLMKTEQKKKAQVFLTFHIIRKQVWLSKWTTVFRTWWIWTRTPSCQRCFCIWSKRAEPRWASSSRTPVMTFSSQELLLLIGTGESPGSLVIQCSVLLSKTKQEKVVNSYNQYVAFEFKLELYDFYFFFFFYLKCHK